MSHPVRAPTITKGSSSWKRTDKTKPVRSRWCGSARPPLPPVSPCRRRSVRSAEPRIAAHLPQTHTGHGQGLCGSPPSRRAAQVGLTRLCCCIVLRLPRRRSVDSRSSAITAGAKVFPQIETEKHRKRQVVLDDSR